MHTVIYKNPEGVYTRKNYHDWHYAVKFYDSLNETPKAIIMENRKGKRFVYHKYMQTKGGKIWCVRPSLAGLV